jgi:hypothetical protein
VTPPAPRRAVLAHEARLDILCCLEPDDPLGIEAVSKRVRRDSRIVKYHLRILDRFQLVGRKRRCGEVGPTDYVLCIGQHPAWVAEAVEAHRSS